MATPSLTPAQRAQILADPNVQAIMQDPRYSTPMLRDAAVNDYLGNDPRSPFRHLFGAGANLNSQGVPAGALHFDPVTGETQFTNTYGHPGWMKIVGLGSVGALGGLDALGFLGGGGSGGASAAAAPLSAGPYSGGAGAPAGLVVGGVPETVSAATSGAGLGAVAPVVAGAGTNAATNAATGAGASALKDLLSAKGLTGIAGLIAALATRPRGIQQSQIPYDAQMQQLLNTSIGRVNRTDPLHQAVTQLAMNRLPTNVQR